MRLEGGPLAAHLEEALPDYSFAFQGGRGSANGEVRHQTLSVAAGRRGEPRAGLGLEGVSGGEV
jgi:hypothetical protein